MALKQLFFKGLKSTFRFLKGLTKISTKSVRLCLKIIFLTLLAGLISIFVFFSTVDLGTYRVVISQKISNAIGFKTQIKGDMEFDIKYMRPVIELKKIEVYNPTWASEKFFLKANRAFLSVDFFSLLRGEVHIHALFLDGVVANFIEKGKKQNWLPSKNQSDLEKQKKIEKKDSQSPLEKTFVPLKFPVNASIRNFLLKRVQVNYSINSKKETYDIEELNLKMETNKTETDLSGYVSYSGDRYALFAKTASLEKILKRKGVYPLDLSLRSPNIALMLKGKLGFPFSDFLSELKLTIEASDLNRTLKPFGLDVSYTHSVNLSSKLYLTEKFFRFSDLKLRVANSDITGDGYVLLKEKKPFVKLNLLSTLFDIPRLFDTEGPSVHSNAPKAYEKEGRDPKAFIGVPFPISVFNTFNADLDLYVKTLKAMSTMPIHSIHVKGTLLNGVGAVKSIETKYAGGNVLLQGVADFSDRKQMKAKVSLKGDDVSVGEIIEMSGSRRVLNPDTSLADVEGFLEGNGPDLATFMGSLDGVFKVNTQKKTWGYDIAQYFLGQDLIMSFVDKFKERGKDLDIECVAGHVRINHGVATTKRSIALQSDKINMVVEGHVDLGKEYTKVSLISLPVSGLRLGLSDFLSLVKIQGPMALPDFNISGSKFIEKGLEWGLAAGVAAVFTGGLSAVAAGIGFLGKSWFDSFMQDEHPCQSALLAKYVDEDQQNPMKTPVAGSIIVLNKEVSGLYGSHKRTFKGFLNKMNQNLNRSKKKLMSSQKQSN
ncbi:MAG: AsmA family protein [Alphaproteobacteria bacterium]|nr:AsmA family protein [Alphaproteobacteria bacterium]MBN2779680.1 AsmA family protein [Alphaproteobacteria bacterium]